MILQLEQGGTEEIDVPEEQANACCISEVEAVNIAKAGVGIEKSFGSPRDIEWGIVNGNVHIFQSRPITTLDTLTDFEVMHWNDTGLRTEREFLSFANIGEVFPGAMSSLGMTACLKSFNLLIQRLECKENWGGRIPFNPYFDASMNFFESHMLINCVDMFFRNNDNVDDFMTKSLMVSLFGKILNEPELEELGKVRYGAPPLWRKIYQMILLIRTCRTAPANVDQGEAAVESTALPVESYTNPEELFKAIGHLTMIHSSKVCLCHYLASFSSSLYNLSLMSLLASCYGGFTEDVYADFGMLLTSISSAGSVVSANVPVAIEKLARTIAQEIFPEKFKTMTDQEILDWLNSTDTPAGKEFRKLLETHGHRGIMEFDPLRKPWRLDPLPLIQSIKPLVGAPVPTEKKPEEVDPTSKLKVKLPWIKKKIFQFFLNGSKNGVMLRERSKSAIVKSVDNIRTAILHLGKLLAAEGKIPDPDLICHYTWEEIKYILKKPSPRIAMRAQHRKRIHSQVDSYRYPELHCGIPKHHQLNDYFTPSTNGEAKKKLKAISVTKASVRAPVCVCKSIADGQNIKQGDILITYSTDIGWSPYFPLISGIVTELGGLISHGAVVAREYGLPCVIGAKGACSLFKTGDMVYLNGSAGTLEEA